MQPVGLALVDHLYFFLQVEEVGGEQGGGYEGFHSFFLGVGDSVEFLGLAWVSFGETPCELSDAV